MARSGLPLFDHPGRQRRSGEIVCFPLARRYSRVLHAADKLREREGKARDRYWRACIGNIRRQLEGQGFDQETVIQELTAFRDAVESALNAAPFHSTAS